MNDALKALQIDIAALRREAGLNFISLGKAVNKARRKDVSGVKVGYFKPRFRKEGDEYKYARKNDGNVSYTIVNPESIGRKISASRLRKYYALLRALSATSHIDEIVVTIGSCKRDELFLKREAKKAKHAFKRPL